MPFKSRAQRRKFAEPLVSGEISDQPNEEWNRSTGTKELPERLHPEAGAKGKTKTAATKKPVTKTTSRTRSKARTR